jgi:hypothetical protein
MAKRTIRVSDLTGDEIQDGAGATVRIVYADARRGSVELDVTGEEQAVKELLEKGRKVSRRGRKPSKAS